MRLLRGPRGQIVGHGGILCTLYFLGPRAQRTSEFMMDGLGLLMLLAVKTDQCEHFLPKALNPKP